MFQAYQHQSTLTGAKALLHPAGTVNTNNARAIQIEIVGQAVNAPGFPQKYLDGIATLMRWIEAEKGIPPRTVKFLPYPSSAGNSAVRMSPNAWLGFSGTCGHQHVPANDHGDPGSINVNYLMGTTGTVWPPSDPTAAAADTPGTNGQPGDFGKCTSEGRSGVCQQTASCGGTVVAGLCAGPASVACCLENYGHCTVAATGTTPSFVGTCQESSTCNGKKVAGLCPGPSSVSCCIPDYGSCATGSQTGTCMPTSTCKGTVAHGLCPGPATVSCCLPQKPATNLGSCSVSYPTGAVTGQCISKSQCASPHIVTPGLCPGSADIGCCHNPAPIRTYGDCGNGGSCMAISSCSGVVQRGLCPGASSIACCEHPDRAPAPAAKPISHPRSLFAQEVSTSGSVTFGSAAPAWTSAQLTLCTAAGVQGFCMDGSVGDAVCNGIATYPSSCQGTSACCTPQVCTLSNTTSGICIPPTECANVGGYVTPGYCGSTPGAADGVTSCCTDVGAAACDTDGLLQCLLGDGDAAICAASFNCPPLPDYASLTSAGATDNLYVQSAASDGLPAHNVTEEADAPAPDDGGSSSSSSSTGENESSAMAHSSVLALFVAIFVAIVANQQ